MTWKEFKKVMDKKLKEAGMKETDQVWYIDVVYPTKESLIVHIGKDRDITVT